MYNPTKPTKKKVIKLIQTTWKTPYLSITPNTYAVFKEKVSGFKVDHTDGIGTKGWYHYQKKTFKNAVLDALAMNINDLVMVGATAYKLQNHIVLTKDDDDAIYEIMKALVSECKKRKIAITGGETSIQNTSDGMDISITVTGFIKKLQKNECKTGDILIGLRSSGLHSNGFTKVREVFKKEIRDEFVTPTKIYADEILPLLEKNKIHGMMHMTGGAFTKLKDILGKNNAIIHRDHTIRPQQVFFDLYKKDLSDEEMYTTFNCGIGFILSVDKKDAQTILQSLKHAAIIGEVVKGTGVVTIESMFSDKIINL